MFPDVSCMLGSVLGAVLTSAVCQARCWVLSWFEPIQSSRMLWPFWLLKKGAHGGPEKMLARSLSLLLGAASHPLPVCKGQSASNGWTWPAPTMTSSPTACFLAHSAPDTLGSERAILFSSVQFSSVTQSCLTLCNPMDCSTPGLPVHHQLLKFTQTHVHWVGDAIQLSHPLSSPSPPTFNLSQHQDLLKWVSSSHQSIGVSASTSVLPMSTQDWSPLEWTGWISLQSKGLSRVFSNTTVQNSSALSFLYSPTLTSIYDHWKNHSLD